MLTSPDRVVVQMSHLQRAQLHDTPIGRSILTKVEPSQNQRKRNDLVREKLHLEREKRQKALQVQLILMVQEAAGKMMLDYFFIIINSFEKSQKFERVIWKYFMVCNVGSSSQLF